MKHLYLYTATAGLGDYLVMGGLARTVERYGEGSRCLVVHRRNPYVQLWPDGDWRQRFFDLCLPGQLASLAGALRRARRQGYTAFGLQMAPGSLQGFCFLSLLRRLRLIDYVVDANLINADIILPPPRRYIYHWHLSQLTALRGRPFPPEASCMRLPLASIEEEAAGDAVGGPARIRVGIHPWSRRGRFPTFVWPEEKWLAVIGALIDRAGEVETVVFGKDPGFERFREKIARRYGQRAAVIRFRPSGTVRELVATIQNLDLLVSVNTAVVHIGYALAKEMVILNGPSLDLWTPQGRGIRVCRDQQALFPGNDRWTSDPRFPSIARIGVEQVLDAMWATLEEG